METELAAQVADLEASVSRLRARVRSLEEEAEQYRGDVWRARAALINIAEGADL